MKDFAPVALVFFGLTSWVAGQDAAREARALERKGEGSVAHALLQKAVRSSPGDPTALQNYAAFLDRYDDPETRGTFEKALGALKDDREGQARVARRLVLLDLIEGDRAAAARHFEVYRGAGGKDWPDGLPVQKAREAQPTVEIPGPLRSFSRMAALAPDGSLEDLLPALARNVVTNGYQASASGEALEPTEYMKLLTRYLSQARELTKLAGEPGAIRIETCDSTQTADLLRVLGYRMRGACGSDVVLETVNASRAFLTIDSGFPIAALEQALRTNRPFVYEYRPTRAPVLYGADYWLSAKEKQSGEFIDVFLGDPTVCRAYLGMAKLGTATAAEMRKAVPVARLKAFAHVLDFFGSMFEIENGKALVPGGAKSAAAWAELVGVRPEQGGAFFEKLIAKDDGWLASYYDALARMNGPVKEYLTEPQRMKRFYTALRGHVTSPGPARPVFRSNADLMLLSTRLRLDADGRPYVPGSIDVWKNLFVNHPHGKYDSRLTRAASNWKDADDVLEALFGLCRKSVENEPLKIYMALSDLDRGRTKPFEPATVDRMARDYRVYGAQYSIFNESPAIGDRTVVEYLDTARAISRVGDAQMRGELAGTMQGLAGVWQIFCRQGSIPEAEADASLAAIVAPFASIHNRRELFDAGRSGVRLLLKAAGTGDSASAQDSLVGLLAGTAKTADADTQAQVVQEMVRIFEFQRLVSLDTLFELADNVEGVAKGQKLNSALVGRLASRISEIQAPRESLTSLERNSLAFGYWSERHIDAERRVNIKLAIERAGADADKLRDVRGLLAYFLRDTLVGFNYIHYAPPGAQLLLANPVFVRSHDFVGMPGVSQTWKYTEVVGGGWPSSAGGRLVGSLAGLPYSLAESEQNFMVPVREQALIWGDLVPQLILTAKIPRWWSVTPAQMHWVGLHMRYAETLVAESALDAGLRAQVVEVLGRLAAPARVHAVDDLLAQGQVRMAIENTTPCELFLVAQQMLERDHGSELFAADIREVQQEAPERVNYKAISRAFGTPKPTLTNSYQPELLYLRTFPTLMGYSSRIMAESWESTLLYWAALADAVHIPPTQLNILIPEWTQKTVERIFATHLEDWPALLRSLRTVGEDVRLKLRMQMDMEQKASLQ
jgi:hypothetical protein